MGRLEQWVWPAPDPKVSSRRSSCAGDPQLDPLFACGSDPCMRSRRRYRSANGFTYRLH
jgi:hypothetical protein